MRMTLMSLIVSSFLIMTGCGVSNTADDTKISNTPCQHRLQRKTN
jgi:hypothetical protein